MSRSVPAGSQEVEVAFNVINERAVLKLLDIWHRLEWTDLYTTFQESSSLFYVDLRGFQQTQDLNFHGKNWHQNLVA
jgi:hypothetical protein